MDVEIPVPEVGRSVFVIPPEAFKSKRAHVVILNDAAWSIVQAQRCLDPIWVFPCRGQRMSTMNNTAWQRARQEVGLRAVRVHDLRHTFACRLRAAGVSAEDREALLGHANHSMAGHYASADVGRLLKQANLVLNRQETRTVLRVANAPPVRAVDKRSRKGPAATKRAALAARKSLNFGAPGRMNLGTGARSFRSSRRAGLDAANVYCCGGLQPDPSTGQGGSAATRPVARLAAHVCKGQDHDLVRFELIDECKREAVQHRYPAVSPILPVKRCVWILEDRLENCVDLVFQLNSEPCAARLVVVDLVINLIDRESMDPKLQRLPRVARRRRTCARYSSSVIVSAAPRSTSVPRRSISASHACAAPASGSPSRLRISSSASRARSSAGR